MSSLLLCWVLHIWKDRSSQSVKCEKFAAMETMNDQVQEFRDMMHDMTLEALPDDLILEVCKRLPVRTRFVLRKLSSRFEKLSLQNIYSLDLQAYRDSGVGAAVDVLDLVAQSSRPSDLIQLKVCESDPTHHDLERSGVMDYPDEDEDDPEWQREIAEYEASYAGPNTMDGKIFIWSMVLVLNPCQPVYAGDTANCTVLMLARWHNTFALCCRASVDKDLWDLSPRPKFNVKLHLFSWPILHYSSSFRSIHMTSGLWLLRPSWRQSMSTSKNIVICCNYPEASISLMALNNVGLDLDIFRHFCQQKCPPDAMPGRWWTCLTQYTSLQTLDLSNIKCTSDKSDDVLLFNNDSLASLAVLQNLRKLVRIAFSRSPTVRCTSIFIDCHVPKKYTPQGFVMTRIDLNAVIGVCNGCTITFVWIRQHSLQCTYHKSLIGF